MRLVILCLQCLMLCLVILCLSSYVSLIRQAYMPHDVRLSRLCGRTYLLQKRKRKSWTASGVGQSRSDGRILHNLRYAKQMSAPSYKPEWVDHLVRRGLPTAVGPSERADRLIQGRSAGLGGSAVPSAVVRLGRSLWISYCLRKRKP